VSMIRRPAFVEFEARSCLTRINVLLFHHVSENPIVLTTAHSSASPLYPDPAEAGRRPKDWARVVRGNDTYHHFEPGIRFQSATPSNRRRWPPQRVTEEHLRFAEVL